MTTTTAAPKKGPAPAGAATPARMSLGSLRKGRRKAADRILLVGTEGVGKSTFAAAAEKPIFLAAEDGIRHLDVVSFPEPQTFQDVLDAIRTLATEEHEFKTLVIDTLDWVEPLVWRAVCERNNWKDKAGNPDIEAPGYGKGYIAATEDWRRLLASLDLLRTQKGMEIILLAHAAIKVFQNPAGADYARYECKLNRSAAALVREWVDASLFAVHEEFVTEKNIEKKGKGVSTGRRVLKTVRTAAWDAKNRHGLPEELALSYVDYAAAREAGQPATYDALRSEFVALLGSLEKTDAEKAEALTAFDKQKDDTLFLARQVDRLKTAVAQKGAA